MAEVTGVSYRWPTVGPAQFVIDARQAGRAVATTTIDRTLFQQAPTVRTLTKAQDGFVGTYLAPAGAQKAPAVLVLGGSEGGAPVFSAMVLAARGIPALAIAYFKEPGLPNHLSNIPLSYFDKPLRWLGRQPEVNPEAVWISGGSRGSEAAALVAVHRPELVHGLFDLSPSSTAGCAFIPDGTTPCPGPAWTSGGRAVPYTKEFNNPAPTDEPRAVIPVERINGPVLTLCGGSDLVWNSCTYSRAIAQRLRAHHFTNAYLGLSYPEAGHAVDFPMPYQPTAPAPADALPTYGISPSANDLARAQAWPKILAFITRTR